MQDVLSTLSQSAQTVAVLLVAALVWPIVRVIRERYLVYWAWGWVCLAVALTALFVSFRYPAADAPLRAVYCGGGSGFGFLLWAGCRLYATGRAVRRWHTVWLVPPLAFAAAGPCLLPNFSHLFGWQAGILSAWFAAALFQMRSARPHPGSNVGRRVFVGALVGLTLVFAHYAALMVVYQLFLPPAFRYPHLGYSSLYDLLLDVVLALGMVCIATERMRAELEEKARRLKAAAAELEQTARTDPLTGLLNRRGLAELLTHPERLPAGCVASIDVNDLKPLNDRHGHAAGDVAIQLVARGLRTLFRVTDPILRLGGDEFAVLMPGGSAEELARRMRLLDAALADQRLPGVDGPTDVRVSWGVAVYADAAGVAGALGAADDAMYSQKRERKKESGSVARTAAVVA
jgi:diguanylate cyclase (GGDEF)-like protein